MEPITVDDLPEIRGYTRVRNEPSIDLLRLAHALQHAQTRANQPRLSRYQRTLRHNEVDALRTDLRYLMNVEAGEKYCEFDLELRACGPLVAIAAAISNGRRK